MKKCALIAVLGILAVTSAFADSPAASPGADISFGQLGTRYSGVPAGNLDLPEPVPGPAAMDALRDDDRYWITVLAADNRARTTLLGSGMDIVEIKGDKTSGFMRKHGLELINKRGFVVESRETIYQYSRRQLKDFPAADAAYHNYDRTVALLRRLAGDNSDIASLFSVGKTIEGRDIWCLRLNSAEKGKSRSSKPGAFYIGNHHAREHLSNEVALGLAAYLLAHRNEPQIRDHLNTLDIYIIPMLNPDGVEYDIRNGSYKWHRKNTRVNADGSIGVDLNRNYDSLWCQEGASFYPYEDTYCGTAPFSEPETRAVRDFVSSRRNIKTLMSYHSYSSLLLYPWAGKDSPIENANDLAVYKKMAQAMAGFTGYRAKQASDLYTASGDTTDWAYATAGIFAFTTELEGRSFYPGAGIIARAVENNVKAAVYMLSVTADPYKLLR